MLALFKVNRKVYDATLYKTYTKKHVHESLLVNPTYGIGKS